MNFTYLLLHKQTLLLEEVLELRRTQVLLNQMLHVLKAVRHHHRRRARERLMALDGER